MRVVDLAAAPSLALALTLVACGGATAPSTDGPLSASQDLTELCLPARPGQTLLVGNDVLRLPGGESVTLQGVDLVDGQGVELVDAQLVILTTRTSFGTRDHYPPTAAELGQEGLAADWGARVSARGGTLRAGTATPAPVNLVLAVRAESAEPAVAGSIAMADSILVRYEANGKDYVEPVRTAIRVATGTQGCDAPDASAEPGSAMASGR